MIGYNKVTGATAFFESADNREWTYVDPETNRLMGKLPGIDDPEAFDRAYVRTETQCVACHQADPFVHNPFIDSAKHPHAPNQTVVFGDTTLPCQCTRFPGQSRRIEIDGV